MGPRLAAITGASSGIGAATARRLDALGFDVLIGARRLDRLRQLSEALSDRARSQALDVTEESSVAAFAKAAPDCSTLVCCAGGAIGADPVAEANPDEWRWMWETNVLGVVRTVRHFLPALIRSGNGSVVVVTSLAAHQTYPGGAGYSSAKHAAAAVMDTLRLELVGQPVRVCEVAPGMVESEFSLVRFGGDTARAEAVYRGMKPLSPADVAEAVAWVVSRPAHVNVPRLDIYPADQATATAVHRH
ncbi:SDR family NAD(P)-dependent oxidoreductase [Actinopolymorpha sp. B11F2]|uniref:SDR family NAD(P)-dependent oxidoreductase n=1 Tax=Actinopolymorpha sp. B11F2 TaxID=3160862 RepID=UPI0032E50C3D